MLSYFKSQQPFTVLLVLVFFIVLKTPFFISGTLVHIAPVQNLWNPVGIIFTNVFLNFLLAQTCLFLQAIWFNYLFHHADYHESNTMIPAVYFVLITSLLPVFNEFSIYIIIGFLLLTIFHTLLIINVKEEAKLECFNLGILGGILILINAHFLVFVLFLFFMLYAIKPFRVNEYLMLLFGILFPLYLALSVSYLAGISLNITAFVPEKIRLFLFRRNTLNAVNLILTASYVLFGFISLRGIMYSTGFKRRKNINMLVFFFLGMVITIVFCRDLDETVLTLLFIPVSVFLSLFMLRIRKKRVGEILNAIFAGTILIVNIVRIFK